MLKQILIILLLFFMPLIYSSCNESQIDINSATLEELDNLYRIGPAKAQGIIDTRPYVNIDDLINVIGIGEVTLANIKNQGLACVDEKEEEEKIIEEITENKSLEIESIEITTKKLNKSDTLNKKELNEENIIENITIEKLDVINLNPKDIKTNENNKELGKSNYSMYGLIGFSLLLCCLFLIKKYKISKNEFR